MLKRKKLAITTIAVLALAGCTVPSDVEPAPTVTVTAPAQEPEPTDEYPELTKSEEAQVFLLSGIWDDYDSEEQESMCNFYWMDTEAAFEAFDDGSSGTINETAFNAFFSNMC
jgi:outer membrane biogenesis lipoprotein LolB